MMRKPILLAFVLFLVAMLAVFAVADNVFKVNGRDLTDMSVEELYELEDAIVDSLHVVFERELAASPKGKTVSTYVANEESKKFHYPYCYYAIQMGISRQFITADPSDLVEQGYSPCGRCNPYPDQ